METSEQVAELKPCPFCGDEAVLVDRGNDEWVAHCANRFSRDPESMCAVNGRARSGLVKWQAAATWNTRAH